MSVFTIERTLPPTKTFAVRYYTAYFTGGDYLARVRIVQRRGGRSWKQEDDTYFLDWIPGSELPQGFTGFQFHNISKEPTLDRPGHYRVQLNAVSLVVLACNCKGAVCWRQTGAPCKHRDVITDLLTVGGNHGGVFTADLSQLAEVGTLY